MKKITSIAASVAMGFFLALPIYYLFSYFIVNRDKDQVIEIGYLGVILIAWFIGSAQLVLKTDNPRQTFTVGFLFWASEWLAVAMVLIVVLMITRLVPGLAEKPINPEPANIGEVANNLKKAVDIIGYEIAGVVQIGFCFLMSFFALLGYAVSVFLSHELNKPNQAVNN